MSVESRLEVTQRALRTIADMPISELKKNASSIALQALAISDAPLPSVHLTEREIRLMEELIERVEGLTRKIDAMESAKAKLSLQAAGANPHLNWVKLDKYVELTGDSVDSVMSRRKAGKWLDGNQCKIVDGRLWIDLRAAQRWVEEWDASSPMLSAGLPPAKAKK